MSRRRISWRQLAAVGAILLLGACAQQTPVASNPPPVAPGPHAVWYTVSFATGSYVLDAKGKSTVKEVIAYLQHNPAAVVTIIGRTDTVGTKDFNMHLSHRRADDVRDLIVYNGKISMDRVETRWTGEARPDMPTPDQVAAKENRVVDIAIH